MNAAQFRALVGHLQAWDGSEGTYQDMRAAPFFDIVEDQRLARTVWKLGDPKLAPNHRRWLWSKVKTRLAAFVTRGSPRQIDGKVDDGEWRIEIPAAPCGWLNANQSLDRRVAARMRSEWRGHTFGVAARQKKYLPRGLEYVKVEIQFQVKTYGLRDNANLQPTAKPIIDALGPQRTYQNKGKWVHEPGLGVYVGDDPTHLAGGSAFIDWTDEPYTGPLDGIAWMRIIDLS